MAPASFPFLLDQIQLAVDGAGGALEREGLGARGCQRIEEPAELFGRDAANSGLEPPAVPSTG